MKTIQTLSVMILGLCLMLIAAPANAVPPGTQQEDLQCDRLEAGCLVEDMGLYVDTLRVLCDATDAAGEPSGSLKQRDRDGLVSKVLMAGSKLSQGKPTDAEQKLGDYEGKLEQLMATLAVPGKEKISEEDANVLWAALIAAQMCVNDLLP